MEDKRIIQLRKNICEYQDALKQKNSDIECYIENEKRLGALIKKLLDTGDFYTSAIEADPFDMRTDYTEWEKEAKQLLFILELE